MAYKPGSILRDNLLLGPITSELHRTVCSSLSLEFLPKFATFRQGYRADIVLEAREHQHSYDQWGPKIASALYSTSDLVWNRVPTLKISFCVSGTGTGFLGASSSQLERLGAVCFVYLISS